MIHRLIVLWVMGLLAGSFCYAQDSLDVAYVLTATGHWQLIDRSNAVIAQDLFEHDSLAVLSCSGGMAVMEKGGRYGFRDLFDDITIAADYDTVTAFRNQRAAVRRGGAWQLIDRRGALVHSLTDREADAYLRPEPDPACLGGYCLSDSGETINCRRPDGRWMLAQTDAFIAPWNNVQSFTGNRILKYQVMANKVCSCQKLTSYYGFADTTGKWAIAPAFEQADLFSCGLAAVSEGSEEMYTFGYIDTTGAWIIPPVYQEAGRFTRVGR